MRVSTIRSDLLDRIPFIMQDMISDKNIGHTLIRQRKIDIGNILKILHSCRNTIQYTKLYQDSGFHYKESFGVYLHFCTRFGLINRCELKKNHNVNYTITPKGNQFYQMFVIEPSQIMP